MMRTLPALLIGGLLLMGALSGCSSIAGTPTPTPWVASADLQGEIIYLDGWEDGMHLCLILPDRSDLRCEFLGEQLAIDFAWARNGSQVAYLVQPLTGEFTEVWTADPQDLKSAQRIFAAGMDFPSPPTLSADGQWLVVEARELAGATSDLLAVNLTATTTVIPIVAANSEFDDGSPKFSPLENRLLFTSNRLEGDNARLKVYAADVDGSRLEQLAAEEGSDLFAPAWSPDGQWVAYFRRSAHSQNDAGDGLWVMEADGSDPRQVAAVANLTLDSDAPVWSPDGNRIAFLQNEEGGGEEWVNPQVWVVKLTTQGGEKPIQVSKPGTTNFLVSWSPDGRALVYTQRDEVDYFLFVVRADGTDRQKFIECTLCAFGAWSPD